MWEIVQRNDFSLQKKISAQHVALCFFKNKLSFVYAQALQ